MPGRGGRAGFRPRRRNRAFCGIGAETGGSMLTNRLALVPIGAETGGRAKVTALAAIGAETGGSTATRARIAIGAEAGGAFQDNLTYANGFAHRIEVEVPAERVEATTTGFLFYFSETYPELRTTANGGLVQNTSGFDQRWVRVDEVGAETVLAYRRVTWSATTGQHVARVLIPSVTAGQRVRLRLYFGKAGLSADEQAATAAYAGYVLALDARTGADLTGQGRDFTPTSVATGSLIGDAGSYNGTSSRLERTALAALDGLPAVTIEAWINASSIGHSGPIFAGGPSTAANDGALGVVLRFDKVGNDTSGANVVAFKVQAADGTTRFESSADTQLTGPAYIAGQYQAGIAPRVWLNDAFLTQANTPVIRTGVANLVRGGSAWVGFSPITDTDTSVDPPIVSGLHINPFTKSCGYHRPMGIGRTGARADDVSTPDAWKNYYGIPKGFFTAGAGSPADTPAVPGSRGRLSTIRSFRIEGGGKFSKYSLENDTSWTVFEVRDQNATGTVLVNQGFPEAFKTIFAIERRADGSIIASDNVIAIYYPATDVCRLFFSLDWDPDFGPAGGFLCGFVRTFSLKGVGHGAPTRSDTQDLGSSATRIRQPPGWILREEDCRLLRPMRYVIHATATRRSNNTSQLTANHILGRSRIWPAAGVDSNAGDDTGSGGLPNNQGDIPYGTLLTIRRMDWGLRNSASLGLTALGKLLFDQLRFYGLRVMDGNAVFIGSGATQGSCLQVRISGGPASNGYLWANTLRADVNAEYAKMTELLWPVMNTRDYGAETELHTDGFWYSAGGGPVDGKPSTTTECINTAFDA